MVDTLSKNTYPKYMYNPETDVLRIYTNRSNANYYEEVSKDIYFDYDDYTEQFIGLMIVGYKKHDISTIQRTVSDVLDINEIIKLIQVGKYSNFNWLIS